MVSLSEFFSFLNRDNEPRNTTPPVKEEFRMNRRKAFTWIGTGVATIAGVGLYNQTLVDLTPNEKQNIHNISVGRYDAEGRPMVLQAEFRSPWFGDSYAFEGAASGYVVPVDKDRMDGVVSLEEFVAQLRADLATLNIHNPTAESLAEGAKNLDARYFQERRALGELQAHDYSEDSPEYKKAKAALAPYTEKKDLLNAVRAKLGVVDFINNNIWDVRPHYRAEPIVLTDKAFAQATLEPQQR